MNPRIFILGSSGYIGSILVRELKKYFEYVIGIDRSVISDLTNYKILDEYFRQTSSNFKDNYVINCAASGGKQKLGEYNKDELWNNLKINNNIIRLSPFYRQYINIGSGAELDISKPIIDAVENEFFEVLPKDSYGLSKNLIARDIILGNHGLNLRLFGCFDPIEPDYRFVNTCVRNCISGIPIIIKEDKYFSWISGIDLGDVIQQLIKHFNNDKALDSFDLNCAYTKKIRLSELAYHVARICGNNIDIKIVNKNGGEYSCNSYLLESDFNLGVGLEHSLIHYINEKIKI